LCFLQAASPSSCARQLAWTIKRTSCRRDTPVWIATVYWLAGVLAAAGLAGIGTWVAFGAGARHLTMSGPIGGPLGEGIGRTLFGIGAIITWLLVIALARTGAKKIFGRKS
jgi:hypothetical protein